MVIAHGVHDLLRVEPDVAADWLAPIWVTSALQRAPWVVVRRARMDNGVAVGVRGNMRSERFAATIADERVRETLKPSDLVARIGSRGRLETTFHQIARLAERLRVRICPTGSFAFQLASNVVSTHAESDLDLLVDGHGLAPASWQCLAIESKAIGVASGVRIDIEVAFGDLGIALDELVLGGTLIAKSPAGPRLIACPS